MKQALLVFFITLVTAITQAQSVDFNWVQQNGYDVQQASETIATDKSGNVFSLSTRDGVTKSDASGNIIWSNSLVGRSICVDAGGNVYVTGYFGGTYDFDPGPGINNLTSIFLVDFFVCKLDGAGNFIWVKQFGGYYSDPESDFFTLPNTYISIDGEGNVYLNGEFDVSADFDPGPGTFNITPNGSTDCFVLKLDALGNFLWAKQVGTLFNNRSIADISVDVQGNVYSAGNDGTIIKLDASGSLIWSVRQSGGIGCVSIAVDAGGNVFASGTFTGNVDFDPGPAIYRLSANPGDKNYLLKLDGNGNFLWAKKMEYYGFLSGDIALDKNGSIYITGRFNGNKDFDPGPDSYFMQTVDNTYDIYLTKIDGSGNFIWANRIGGSGDDNGYSITVDDNANIYIKGFFQNTVDFDPGPGVFNLSEGTRNYNSFVLKLGTCTSGCGLSYKFYEGDFNTLPDFSVLTPTKTGNTANVDISVRRTGVDDHFAFTWNGTLIIPTSGTYTFETVSDDGSKLSFNGNALVNNDGVHGANSATGTVAISAGTYPISISYFEKDGGQYMQVYWTGPGITRQLIPDAAFGSAIPVPPAFQGLSYKYYEGNFSRLPDFNLLTPVKTGRSANADISLRPAGVDDHFAFLWQGYINLPTAGTYTFETISDDGSRIYFDANFDPNLNGLVNNNGIHAPASATGTVTVSSGGAYQITITYFEKDGGETLQLYWTGPGISRQPIPDAAFISGTTASNGGLNYRYYEGAFDALPDYTTLTPIKTGTTSNLDINVRPTDVNDYFGFMWDGYIDLPVAGTYTFETISDDGSRVSINGSNVVENDGLHAPKSATGSVTVLSAGKYPITVTFFEKNGGETMQLYWTGPGISRQTVPDAAFTTTSNNIAIMSGTQTRNLLSGDSRDGFATSALPKVYPNPFVDNFTIDYYNPGSVKNKASVDIYDLNGRLIYNYQPVSLLAGHNRWLINTRRTKLATGVYIAQLKVNGVPEKVIRLIKK